MRIKRIDGEIIRLNNLIFSWEIYSILLRLSLLCPDLRLEGVAETELVPTREPLFNLVIDWGEINTLNDSRSKG